MISLKSPDEIEAMARACRIIAELHEQLPDHIRPGVTTGEVDRFADAFIRGHEGAVPAFKGLYGFPRSVCISVNQEVVHGIPTEGRKLVEGDIVSVDVGVELDGWFGDAARTFAVGRIDSQTQKLLDVTQAALNRGIEHARVGNRLGDVGYAIQSVAEEGGFAVVRDLVGHGIGRKPHESPNVPNWGRRGRGLKLKAGLVLAIEPMLNAGSPDIRTLDDDWTVVTADDRPSAHFEQTVAILDDGPRILTSLNGR